MSMNLLSCKWTLVPENRPNLGVCLVQECVSYTRQYGTRRSKVVRICLRLDWNCVLFTRTAVFFLLHAHEVPDFVRLISPQCFQESQPHKFAYILQRCGHNTSPYVYHAQPAASVKFNVAQRDTISQSCHSSCGRHGFSHFKRKVTGSHHLSTFKWSYFCLITISMLCILIPISQKHDHFHVDSVMRSPSHPPFCVTDPLRNLILIKEVSTHAWKMILVQPNNSFLDQRSRKKSSCDFNRTIFQARVSPYVTSRHVTSQLRVSAQRWNVQT